MSDQLDPEDVQEIMSRIFGEATGVVIKYGGHVEKLIGDAMMVLFGVPTANEDDPVRAIKAALEIHQIVEDLSPELCEKIGRPLAMHTGINTGVVLTNAIDLETNRERLLGDSINVASRLTSLAKGGEIVVGKDTMKQAEHFFKFESLGAQELKGKSQAVEAFMVGEAAPSAPGKTLYSGLQSKLVGRDQEIAILEDRMTALTTQGEGTACCLCGEAGTGKSRLAREFRATLDPLKIGWHEGRAYSHTQQTPYSLFIDLFNQAWGISESDPQEQVRGKIRSQIQLLLGEDEQVSKYIEGLYGLGAPDEKEGVPDLWKSRVFKGVKQVFRALADAKPTVFCLKDLHWADASTIDLLRYLLSDHEGAGMFICIYRPPFTLLTSDKSLPLGESYKRINLKPLVAADIRTMTASLLKTDDVPDDLAELVQMKSEGNPFYLEEIVRALIDSRFLLKTGESWRLTKKADEIDIPSTVTGVITSRLDHLEQKKKRLLQEAAVIGRTFLYETLARVTEIDGQIHGLLVELEEHDLIRSRGTEPEKEYIFQHSLTRDVVYKGMLKKERQKLHKKVGATLEDLFENRLSELYETLAFHYKLSAVSGKAVDYLVKSGEKSLKKYAVAEAHQYFQEAYDILDTKKNRTKRDDERLIDVLVELALVAFYRQDFAPLLEVLKSKLDLVEAMDDKDRLGLVYGWLGTALWAEKEFEDSYVYLHLALRLGQETKNKHIIAHAYAWISCASVDLGLRAEALTSGQKALELLSEMESDNFLYYFSLSGRLVRSIVREWDGSTIKQEEEAVRRN